MSTADEQGPILDVRGLSVTFPARGEHGRVISALNDVNLAVYRGETLAVVGESGCGKTTLARTVVRLQEPAAGQVIFEGSDIARYASRQLRAIRSRLQMVFQDPFSSLDPRMTIGEIIAEPLRLHTRHGRRERGRRVHELLDLVGLSASAAERRPAEFSGGQRQRIGISRALATEPSVLVCDEPTSGLDVSVQAQVLNLLDELKVELGLTLLFISHNMGVVRQVSDRVAVMYLGRVVEIGRTDNIFTDPRHPYTKALLAVVPDPMSAEGPRSRRAVLSGELPSPLNIPVGCSFHTRCPLAIDRCVDDVPPLGRVGDGRQAACWRSHEVPKWHPRTISPEGESS